MSGIHSLQLRDGQRLERARAIRRPLQRVVVMDDDNPVAREVHVELEAVGAEREPVLEGRERVLGPQSRSAAMGVDERAGQKRCRQKSDLTVSSALRLSAPTPNTPQARLRLARPRS